MASKGFTVLSVKALPDGKHADPGCVGLYLWVRGNSRTWQMRYSMAGKPQYLSLGPVKNVTLAEARDAVADVRQKLKHGEDPKAAPKVITKPSTFQEDAEAYHSHMKSEWCQLHARYWMQSMTKHAFPLIGAKDTASITVQDIVDVLKPIWTDHNTLALNIHSRIKSTIEYAMDNDDHGRFITNPADRALRRLPRGHGRRQVPHPTIEWSEAPDLYRRLTASDDQAALALRLLLLTGTPRAAEVFGLRWDEIDNGVMNIPDERMKSGVGRTIPLTDAAQALLATVPKTDEFVFPGRKGGDIKKFVGHMHAGAMQLLLNELFGKGKVHVHGLRSTFRTWVSDHAETVRDHDAAEINLDHRIGSRVQRAYDRADMLEERRVLLGRWATFLGT